jgi:hypothetical protein
VSTSPNNLRWFHQCVAIVRNKHYRCSKCHKDFDLAGAVQHAVEQQVAIRETP